MQAAAPRQEESEPHFRTNGAFPPPSACPRSRRAAPPCRPRPRSRRDPTARRCPRGRGPGVPGTQGPLLRLARLSPLPQQTEPWRLLPAQGVRGRGRRGSLRPGRTLGPGCLFKFGEVGPTPSKGAWGFGVNPCQASQQTPLRGGSPSVKAAGHTRGSGPSPGSAWAERAASPRQAPAQLWAQAHPGSPSPKSSPTRGTGQPRDSSRRPHRASAAQPQHAKAGACCRSYTEKVGNKNF